MSGHILEKKTGWQVNNNYKDIRNVHKLCLLLWERWYLRICVANINQHFFYILFINKHKQCQDLTVAPQYHLTGVWAHVLISLYNSTQQYNLSWCFDYLLIPIKLMYVYMREPDILICVHKNAKAVIEQFSRRNRINQHCLGSITSMNASDMQRHNNDFRWIFFQSSLLFH